MRIGVIAYEMEGRATGVGRYLEGLLEGAAATGSADDHWILFFRGDRFAHPLWDRSARPSAASKRPPGPRFEARFDQRGDRHPILWEQLRLPRLLRRAHLDVLFSPGYSLPEGVDVPKVVTLHDLSFEHLGEEFGLKERWRRRLLARRAARTAQRVLADTQTIARDLRQTYRLAENHVEVIPLGLAEVFRSQEEDLRPSDDPRLAEVGVEPPFVLAVGSILPRRRLDRVIQAFRALAPRFPDVQWVVAGANRLPHPPDLDRWIAEADLGDRLRRIDWVPEGALPTLYRRASAVVYLSTYEGFGLPPLEALAVGTPVVTSPGLALDDLLSDVPYRVDPDSEVEIQDALAEILEDPDAARQRIEPHRQALSGLDWRGPAQELRNLFDQVVEDWRRSRR